MILNFSKSVDYTKRATKFPRMDWISKRQNGEIFVKGYVWGGGGSQMVGKCHSLEILKQGLLLQKIKKKA